MSARAQKTTRSKRRLARLARSFALVAALGAFAPLVAAPAPSFAGDRGYCQKNRCVSYLQMKRIARNALAPGWRILDLRTQAAPGAPGGKLWAARVSGPRATGTYYWYLNGARAR